MSQDFFNDQVFWGQPNGVITEPPASIDHSFATPVSTPVSTFHFRMLDGNEDAL